MRATLIALVLTLAACSPASSDEGDLLAPDSTGVVLSLHGGYFKGAPSGSECSPADDTWTLNLATNELGSKVCRESATGAYTYITDARTLTSDQIAPVLRQLHAMLRSTAVSCTADRVRAAVTMRAASGDTTYQDEQSCDGAQAPHATGIREVISVLSQVSNQG